MNNPLLKSFDLPPFSEIETSHIRPAIEQILSENREQIAQLQHIDDIDWTKLVQPLELLDDRLSKAWSPVRHLNSVQSSEQLRKEYDSCLPLLSEYHTEIGHNRRLFEAFNRIYQQADFKQLSPAQQKTITDSLLHFKLGGVDLTGEDKQLFSLIQKRLSELQSRFQNNILDATESWGMHISDKHQLQGLPDYALDMLKQYAEQKSLDGYRITLDMPCYIAVITHADDRDLRKALYLAYTTRASEQGVTDKKWDNAGNMVEILQKREEKAKLLGYDNYAELSLETKMASSVDEVIGFLTELSDKSLAAAKQEYQELEEFARGQGLNGELMAWDLAYYSEKLKHQRYQIRDEDLKPYFADDHVIDGLFQIVQRLYAVRFVQVKQGIDVWHEDVRFYRIEDPGGELLGEFYLDLYARNAKRGGAWMDECVNRYVIDGKTQTPVAYLTCNLTPPIGDQPALFTHDEVITLFHEFGHGLHHMLTRIDVPEVAGINGVEWDAVELPSQFMENFCWEKQALDLFARHYQTGQVLPDELFGKMIEARNFQSAMQMCRQLEFALFDIKLHQQTGIDSAQQIQQILDQVRNQVAVVRPPSFNRFQNSFSHIFAGGYAAGYYSYKWAEVLSADAFSMFEQEGIFNPDTGRRFLECILQRGGSRPARESFVCFMGREPDIEALLRHNGIAH